MSYSLAQRRMILSFQHCKTMVSPSHEDAYRELYYNFVAEASGGTFQIRPHKEFVPSKGRNKLLSLNFLARLDCDLTSTHEDASDISSATGIRNAYDFMAKRREATGDPGMQRWNAAIRLANFASLESAPLCVSQVACDMNQGMTACIDIFSRGTSGFPYSRTSSRRAG